MKKITLITFLSFFINPAFSFSSENIKIATYSINNFRVIYKCKDQDTKLELTFARHNNLSTNPIMVQIYNNDNSHIRILSNLFLDTSNKEFVFYDNQLGILISKYRFVGDIEQPILKKISISGGNKGETLRKDFVELNKKGDVVGIKKYATELKDYSISLKNYFEESLKKDYIKKSSTESDLICERIQILEFK